MLSLPLVGGGGILDGSVLVLTDDLGNNVIFEFNLTNTAPTVIGSIAVDYDTFGTVDVVANNLVTEINAANVGIVGPEHGGSDGSSSVGSPTIAWTLTDSRRQSYDDDSRTQRRNAASRDVTDGEVMRSGKAERR